MKKIKLYKFLKKVTPTGLKKVLRNNIYIPEYDEYSLAKTNPYLNDPDTVIYHESPIKVGIIYGGIQYHKHWIAACHELKISYQIIYLEKKDWIDQVKNSKCDVFLTWPDVRTEEVKLMVDERLRIMNEELNLKLYPTLKEIWLYENKRVQNYWLESFNFPRPKTDIFYNVEEAVSFLRQTEFPIVLKSNLGASASGVYILKNRDKAIKMTKDFLHYGYKVKRKGANKRQKGSIYFQKYLANVKEWRMVRIGDSYFGHGKDMEGQFHSGSGKANWDLPPLKAFELLKEITDKGKFHSMDVDLFEDDKGNLYVNELQTVFGNSIAKEQMKIKGVPGRYLLKNNKWYFEAGSFCENHLCNLRITYIIDNLKDIHATKK
ncbi:ATP-grasp domain-containing protein [Brumimicrobium oceani]|uniref:ATP-grasp domain-containing protein n=1 Tax=Brumimicrobium oceani TaxID=2100725 RepID=A0A2U2XF71_9FLAO|nr:hypothetical protein [Brumimicrobium oceani]PWH86413.1 hypothetical protein DIT68_04015 [Brumimicrobium oceani]